MVKTMCIYIYLGMGMVIGIIHGGLYMDLYVWEWEPQHLWWFNGENMWFNGGKINDVNPGLMSSPFFVAVENWVP